MVSHWDDVERVRREVGDMRSWWRDLGGAAGSTAVGVQRIEIDPGFRAGPVHVHGAEEEIFHVLGGSGLVWLDGAAHEVGPGDTIVCLASGPEHTFIAGDAGLDVLAFGENLDPPLVRLPRAGVLRNGSFWARAGDGDPLEREAAAGPLEPPAPTPRPACVVALDEIPAESDARGEFATTERDVGRAAGSVSTGLRHAVLPPGKASCPPHWHSAEHELFVVLEGGGALELYDRAGRLSETQPLRAGSVVSRPAGTAVAHLLRAGEAGMTYLPYGMRRPSEIVFYPRSRKAWVGQVMVRFETVDDYWDGEL